MAKSESISNNLGNLCGFKVRFFDVPDDPVGPDEGGFHTPKLKDTNSSSKSYMMFKTFYYIH